MSIQISISNSIKGSLNNPAGTPPVNTVAPVITGTAQEGQTVTCSTGTWTGTPTITYAYQWKRNGSNIGSATNSTYTLVSADVSQSITCQATATNGVGNATATSNAITPTAILLLDTYTGATVAYSLRKLRTAYTGNAIRVRRSSDNTEQNIGFVNNVLDTASLLTFCGAGNGFVTTWYDQSGNANNASQGTAVFQPQIVSSGAMITINGKNSMSFDGSNDELNLSSTINVATSNYDSFVGKRDASGRRLTALAQASGGGGYAHMLWSDDYYYYQGKSNQQLKSSATDTTTNQLLLTALNNAGTMSMFKNSSSITSTTINQLVPYTITKIGRLETLYGWCKLQEIVFYNSEQSANRIGIETNINTFYNIY